MRFACVVILLVAVLLVPGTEGGRFWRRVRRALRRVWDIARDGAKEALINAAKNGRDVRSIDLNNDGMIDQSEMEKITSQDEEEARSLMETFDEDGNDVLSLEEMDRGLRELAMLNEDETIENDVDATLQV